MALILSQARKIRAQVNALKTVNGDCENVECRLRRIKSISRYYHFYIRIESACQSGSYEEMRH